MKTSKDLQFIHHSYTGQFSFFKGQSLSRFDKLITVPEGTPVTNKTATGIDENYHFVNDFSFVGNNYSLIHDLTYHGANVPKEFVVK